MFLYKPLCVLMSFVVVVSLKWLSNVFIFMWLGIRVFSFISYSFRSYVTRSWMGKQNYTFTAYDLVLALYIYIYIYIYHVWIKRTLCKNNGDLNLLFVSPNQRLFLCTQNILFPWWSVPLHSAIITQAGRHVHLVVFVSTTKHLLRLWNIDYVLTSAKHISLETFSTGNSLLTFGALLEFC